MKRTMLVLALAVLSCAGCRAVAPYGNAGCCEPVGAQCGDACGDQCGDSCGGQCDGGCGDQCGCGGRGGTLANGPVCQGGRNCAVFGRYCGQDCSGNQCGGCGCCALGCGCLGGGGCCGDGVHPGPYDCSPCSSPNWGCNGYQHPHGYVDGSECYCDSAGNVHGQGRPPGPHFAACGNGYCCAACGQPAAACCCASGDHNYNFNPGPPVAQTAYPYYTLRGPRDFLLNNPPSIGPY